MYNYKNEFSKFLLEAKLIEPSSINEHDLVPNGYCEALGLVQIIRDMNEYLGEWVDGQELFRDTPAMYSIWSRHLQMGNDPSTLPDHATIDARIVDDIEKQMWNLNRTMFQDLILFSIGSRHGR